MPSYYTYKSQVPLLPGQTLGFAAGKGYYAAGAPTPTQATRNTTATPPTVNQPVATPTRTQPVAANAGQVGRNTTASANPTQPVSAGRTTATQSTRLPSVPPRVGATAASSLPPQSANVVRFATRALTVPSTSSKPPRSLPQWQTTAGRERYAFDYFRRALDLTPVQAAGLVGNLAKESLDYIQKPYPALDPRLEQIGSGVPQGRGPVPNVGFGIAQWTTSSRQAGLEALARKNRVGVSNFGTQVEYVVQELHGTSTLAALKRATTVEEATIIIEQHYEVPQDYTEVGASAPSSASYWGRFGYAKEVLSRYGP